MLQEFDWLNYEFAILRFDLRPFNLKYFDFNIKENTETLFRVNYSVCDIEISKLICHLRFGYYPHCLNYYQSKPENPSAFADGNTLLDFKSSGGPKHIDKAWLALYLGVVFIF